MAFDGVTVCALMYELNSKLSGGRVDKVLQPERDEIVLGIRAGGENHRLLVSASSFAPRVHLTENVKENPEAPPLFCMLLRKHILSGKVIGFLQPDFERVLIMEIESRDELGDLSVKRLYIEIMGRHSNVVLVGASGKILGCIKNVDISVSSVRQVLTGLTYSLPPSQNKINPLEASEGQILGIVDCPEPSDKCILGGFTGISPIISREISFRGLGDTTADLSRMDYTQKQSFAKYVKGYFDSIKDGQFTAQLLTNTDNSKLLDFSPVEISQYGISMDIETLTSLSQAIDRFYYQRDRQERAAQRSADLQKFISNNILRCQKKLSLLKNELNDTGNKEKHKIFGDLLTANIYRLTEAMSRVTLDNYYTGEPVEIPLKSDLTATQNAQRYYTLYNKAKNAEIMLTRQIEKCETELEYLESVQSAFENTLTEKEINEIRDELVQANYMVRKAVKGKIRKTPPPSEPLHFTTQDGFDIYVGKNNLQNDRLTLKTSKPDDLWFHVKSFAGSHVVMKAVDRPFTDESILQAAQIAARHSKAKNSAQVPVDYTIIKNVKKTSGAKPGFVIYDHYKTVYVSP